MEICDSLLAWKDNIVIFIIQDGQSYDDDSYLLDNKVLAIKDVWESESHKTRV